MIVEIMVRRSSFAAAWSSTYRFCV